MPSDEVGAARGIERRDATVVTYNESSYEPFQLAASYLMSNNLCLKGFNMNAWLNAATKSDVACRRPPSVPEEGQVLAGRRRRGRRFLACC